MRLFRITQTTFARDLSGNGARLYGGRWNREGSYALYTSESRSLALLENLVHIPFRFLQSKSYSLIEIHVPDEVPIQSLGEGDLPDHWNAWIPSSASVTRRLGNAFLEEGKSLLLKVPSAIIAEDSNYILNPRHPAMRDVTIAAERQLKFDDRLMQILKE